MAEVGIFVGTVYGNALLVAEESETLLLEAGHQVKIYEDATLEEWQHYADKVVLVITSTTGQGDLPDSIAPLFHAIKDKLGHQPGLRYGVIALGDSSYDDFCGGGKKFAELLQEHGAQRVGEMLTVDACENPEPEEVTSPWVEQWAKLIG
ncbi:flavodoxin [Erwinia aphidicola]|jgi:flavodoxin|uniref:Flavodoxin n=1 Tax=Erwinia aphidicola TaxID=68334 RepID=A0ABU8DDM6_ERWAP|nr:MULTISPECIES: flavodoxin [Erwinia]KMV69088.1 flavodoxin [bacteria symbiont BFo1 of Frankliniella occidentalis]PIJ59933.1 flavodoxin [Erwinia sp. OLMDLW33]VTT29344.1 flavoprotein YqcA [Klebsiella pneumoniae]KYP83578.1 flavodoxin [bacteria symbiont BFo1 of Frankliniella occidentalis]KYP88868.1 flavodoxin [bacteria symbiont BFo1 of Frankliniella occidentalis]